MSEVVDRMVRFVEYVARLKGDEKGEAQVFCDRLFRAFGHEGYKEAGAVLEDRVKNEKGTISFVDLLWRKRVLIEMKQRCEKLHQHYRQAFDYWIAAVPDRPRYVVLCNFDEFWIYDFDKQIHQPVDVVAVGDLSKRYDALAFLFPDDRKPVFGNDLEAVTREAADKVARVFNSLVGRGEDRARSQRFILQTVVAMFAEDIDLLPKGLVFRLIDESRDGSSFDLLGGLFRQMNSAEAARGGRYRDVRYFDGGLYALVEPIDLNRTEAILLADAARQDWSRVNPAVFGTLFQNSMGKAQRHAHGAHYTAEADILRVVNPTIVNPWMERIEAAKNAEELFVTRRDLHGFRVLDPACGSGNFLYVAYRELSRLEVRIIERLREELAARDFAKKVRGVWLVDPQNFSGIEIDAFGIELAKVTLMLAKKLGLDEATDTLGRERIDLLALDDALPLDNLDANFTNGDALFVDWPAFDAIIGNPPYQSKNKMQREFGRAYVNRIRERFPDMSGRADYCVYWFRRTHDELRDGQRAGLVGTNTITQNESRDGGLGYIVGNGGTITEAVSSQVWSGDAVVHVSIVNWLKGEHRRKKRLFRQVGDHRDSPWEMREVDRIDAALSWHIDVTNAQKLKANAAGCYQGQTHGHESFLLTPEEAAREVRQQPSAADVLFPYLTGDDLLGNQCSQPSRYVIDFGKRTMLESRRYSSLFARIERNALPARQQAAEEEAARNREALKAGRAAKVTRDHEQALQRWWLLFRHRGEMLAAVEALRRYAVCVRVTRRPIFEFVSAEIHANDALMVFPYDDDYSFGILQSDAHWRWFTARCSTMKRDPRYTSLTVFSTFPWPQMPSKKAAQQVAAAGRRLRDVRQQLMSSEKMTLRDLYRTADKPGKHPVKDAHEALDVAVAAAYGTDVESDWLTHLLDLNLKLENAERRGEEIRGPGLPIGRDTGDFVSTDHVRAPHIEVPKRGASR